MQRYCYLIILSFLMIIGQANAEDISIHGRVVDKPCTVDIDTEYKQIDLGKVIAHNIREAGTGGGWTNFDLLLEDCSASTPFVTAYFVGEPDVNDNNAFKNYGSGANVALQITNADHSVVYGNGSIKVVSINMSTRKATFPLSARIISPLGNAKGGTFNSIVNVDFIYQ
ncbi:fimbrial protein [Buttiauxella agrestis]|uniref:Fimbrial-type adhesion domain-containing protein n=1 Tax=Buttiauxella agrestis ATCC 33320 TaxID=1006004 RepID=A0A085GC70_9ENTR|nr:fimbrial protein [Buttiauxella agrestis]KFC81315.1 hypothetical protein GBAG_2095 [Buttiauxella agrestis ATCC 33320]